MSTLLKTLVHVFKYMFSIFKQHYMYFHTLFHPHVFSKNTNNIIRITLPNGPLKTQTITQLARRKVIVHFPYGKKLTLQCG